LSLVCAATLLKSKKPFHAIEKASCQKVVEHIGVSQRDACGRTDDLLRMREVFLVEHIGVSQRDAYGRTDDLLRMREVLLVEHIGVEPMTSTMPL
jgi:hypothetical protein